MKVLPSNLNDFNDIEKIGDEFYFRNDGDNKKTDVDNTLNIDTMSTPEATSSTNHARYPIELDGGVEVDTHENANHAFDSDNNALREARSTLGYDHVQSGRQSTSKSTPTTITTTSKSQANTEEWENEYLPPHTNIFEAVTLDEFDNIVTDGNRTNGKLSHAENIQKSSAANELSVIDTNRADIGDWERDEDYDSYEDYSVEVKGPKTSRKNQYRLHTSYQKTAIRQPMLQQGFIMSPGYPKYYINTNCSWRISVPSGQRIRLILLDVHLRCKFCTVLECFYAL